MKCIHKFLSKVFKKSVSPDVTVKSSHFLCCQSKKVEYKFLIKLN